MSLYIDYRRISESNHFDKVIYNSLLSVKWSFIILFLISGPILSFVPITVLFIRTLIHDVYIRRFLGWIIILWAYFNGTTSWACIFLSIEILREFIRFGIPYIMMKAGDNIPNDAVAETLARKLFKILRVITQQSSIVSLQQLMLIGIGYSQGDQSEGLNLEEKQKLQKFFRKFSNTSFIYEPDTSSLTIFFPSFITRFTRQGLQLTNDDALKLIRGEDLKEDICPICHDKYANLSIELKCKHQYCHKCIFSWLNHQYTCPVCRAIVQ